MKSRNVLKVFFAVLMVFVFASSAEAGVLDTGPGHREAGGPWGALQTFLALKLTEAQQEQMQVIMAKYQGQERDLRTKMRETGRNTWVELNAAPFNEESARSAFKKASALREDMFILRAKMRAEMKSLLTAEQLNLLQERRAQRFRAFEHGFGPALENPNE